MPEPMDAQQFTGPHPTCREFVAQLAVWGFEQRGEEARTLSSVVRVVDSARDPVPARPR